MTKNQILSSYIDVSKLKKLSRQGWLKRNIPKEYCESVADHSFGVAFLAMLIADACYPDLDMLKVLRMALIHDISEVYAGDIVPNDGIGIKEKHEIEKEAILFILENLGRGKEYFELWNEYEKGTSPEAKFVKQIDKLEMAIQAKVYQESGYPVLDQFIKSAIKGITDQTILDLLEDLR